MSNTDVNLKNFKYTKFNSDLENFGFSDGWELRTREIEILKLIAAGHSNEEIAKTLYISIHTVKSHLEKIFRVLKARNRSNSVFIAISKNIIGCPKAEK